ncbi:MAG TPA: helix-turn-helix domain-containing GNAT family N-acetyltransferase [Gemmatimonadaceae bacterium]|jgi:DNA-binding MarR family transcriptional regulator/predicted N-acetyltransferase YhbS|nr:helix-turn-helix domain-containing GNAT family N-acetyltransferase [Gemmatimonadaceae bacterium]
MPSRSKSPPRAALPGRIAAIRRFNRFYTRLVGALDEGHLHSPFTLAEVRLLFELSRRESPTASELAADLGLDPGYLSRLLRTLQRRRLVSRSRSAHDARASHLTLTATGRAAFRGLDRRANAEVARLLASLDDRAQRRLVDAMATVARLLGAGDEPGAGAAPAYVLRPPRAGDFGWIVQSHGEIYAREYGWNDRFEALVARVVADFVDGFDPARERCWIAERDGENVGSVMVTKDPRRRGVAKLRLLLVHPSARGLGLGHRLVDECTRFARDAGYHTISLWTNRVLTAARRIYAEAGYEMVRTEKHDHFGVPLVAETWEMEL